MYMIFDLLITVFELFISETSDCKCYFLRKESLVSFKGWHKLAFPSAGLTVLHGCSRWCFCLCGAWVLLDVTYTCCIGTILGYV